jgi:5-formyltetrahydrofolate cyclo-ligase
MNSRGSGQSFYNSSDIAARKRELRARFRLQRLSMEGSVWQEACTQIEQSVLSMKPFQSAQVVYSYVAFGREPSTNRILSTLLQSGKTVVTPGVDHKADPPDRLYQAVFQRASDVASPVVPGDVSHVILHDVDMFLVPGIVWDQRGYRIGFGGGFFDRLLAQRKHDSLAVGLGFQFQVLPELLTDPWDMPVDCLVTEAGALECVQNR